MLSSLRLAEPGLIDRLRRVDVERRVALVLVVLAVFAGFATYVVIFQTPPYGSSIHTVLVLLNLDLVLLLLLGAIVARRLVRLWLERQRGLAGSKLHGRLVALFAVVAVTPAIIVSLFSVVFLGSGLETWFSDRIRTALQNSLNVAEAYLEEHKENIRADALAMAADLNREGPLLTSDPYRLQQLVNAQAAVRSLTEAVVFDGTGQVMARTGLSFTMETDELAPDVLARAGTGEVVTLTSGAEDRVRALVRLDGFGEAYLYVGRFVDAEVLGYMQRTQAMVQEYQRMEGGRRGIQITSALLFGIVALLLLLASVWVGLNLADRLVAPISQLILAANRVRAGDLLARVPEGTGPDDEVKDLSRAFNRMTSQLASQRRELVEANRQLDERRRFTEAVLAGVTAGVLGVDAEGFIALPNRSALDFLSAAGNEVAGAPLRTVLPEVAPLLARAQANPHHAVEQQIAISRGGIERTLLVRVAAQSDAGEDAGYVLTFDDITVLLSAQRQAAWSEVARRIAHEIKNPLTPIRLSAERLNRRYLVQIEEGRESFSGAITTIIRQVDQIGHLISEFSNFARMPSPVMKDEDLNEIVRHALFLQQSAWPAVRFERDLPDPPQRLACDADKVGQALTNLLQNAVQALTEAAPAGDGEMATLAVTARVRAEAESVVIEIEDNGPGFPLPERHRLLEPYVTTRAKGTGLGLAIVHKIMEEHGGRVELASGTSGGALARLVFPAYRAGTA